jgi:hypothetical protein
MPGAPRYTITAATTGTISHQYFSKHETDDEQRADQLPDETGHVKTS